jgi:thiol-disulfide isomerase/thioredoxin
MKYTLSLLFLFLMMFSQLSAVQAQGTGVEKEPFTQERFNELRESGAVVLVDIFADWCPTCAKQQKLIQQYREENPDNDFHILEVDFDDNKQAVRELRAPRQSTILLFKGNEQYWYSVAETRYEVFERELNKAFNAAG